MARDEGFVGRWARLKREARGGNDAAPPVGEAVDANAVPPGVERPVAPMQETGSPQPKGGAETLPVDPASLPDVESLTYQSDYGAFLKKGVPLELRNQALRRLWRSSPVLANLDGLVEYGEDFSGVGTKKMVVRTAYRVGRGMIDWALEEPEHKPEAPPQAGKDGSPSAQLPTETDGEEPVGPDEKAARRPARG
jgi:hypothetical protein